jgi:hypothetical protein
MEKDSFVSFELNEQHVLTPLIFYILKNYGMVFWDLMWCSLGAKTIHQPTTYLPNHMKLQNFGVTTQKTKIYHSLL